MIKIPVRVSSDLSPKLAEAMTASVRRHMPDAELIHVVEVGCKKLDCFNSVMHVDPNGDFVDQLLRVMAAIDGDVISLDYDIIVQDDLTHVFDKPFDVAFTKRPEADKTVAKTLQASYNMGVIFSRSPEFWKYAKAIYDVQPDRDGWLRSQSLVSQIALYLSDRFKMIELPGEVYNHSPMTRDEDVSMRKVVHYKGKRKYWMLPESEQFNIADSVAKTTALVKLSKKRSPDAGDRAIPCEVNNNG